MKRYFSLSIILILISNIILSTNPSVAAVTSPQIDITAKSAILLEGSTGTIIYEKNKDEKLQPASITKIMTLLLIFEALDSGKIKLEDQVIVSEHAASMGGSQVYLEPNETQDVNTMIKCISISSANDAAVAMSEHIAGSETEFVAQMNTRAKELGMNNTNFVNCSGLDVDGHYSTAYDVALMSRELITKHPKISEYSTVWMDTFTHVTKKGSSEFGLSNTNKLVRTYTGITGLKTGSTDKAKYCLSATANRNGMDLIAVVMSAPDHKIRFIEAAKLLDYGYANCSIFTDNNNDFTLKTVPIHGGVKNEVGCKVNNNFSYLLINGQDASKIQKEVIVTQDIKAPIKENDAIGIIRYKLDNNEIGKVSIIASESVRLATYKDYFYKALKKYFLL